MFFQGAAVVFVVVLFSLFALLIFFGLLVALQTRLDWESIPHLPMSRKLSHYRYTPFTLQPSLWNFLARDSPHQFNDSLGSDMPPSINIGYDWLFVFMVILLPSVGSCSISSLYNEFICSPQFASSKSLYGFPHHVRISRHFGMTAGCLSIYMLTGTKSFLFKAGTPSWEAYPKLFQKGT